MSLLNEAGFQKRKKAARSGRLAERGFYSRPVRRSSLELPPAARDGVAQCAQPQIDREQYRRPDQNRRIGDAEKGVAKAGNGVEERVQVADEPERAMQIVDRIEGTRKQRQRRDEEIGDGGGVIELFSPEGGQQAKKGERKRGVWGKGVVVRGDEGG